MKQAADKTDKRPRRGKGRPVKLKPDGIYTPQQVMSILQIGYDAYKALCASGKLKSPRMGDDTNSARRHWGATIIALMQRQDV